MNLVHYIFVRKDLPLGVLAAMITHAAGESGAWWGYSEGRELPNHTIAVVLEANDEVHLKRIAIFLAQERFEHETIVESSEPYANQLMAIGLWPEERAYFGDTLSKYQLLKTCLVDIPPKEDVSCENSPNEEKTSDPISDLSMQGVLGCDGRLTQSGC